MNEAAYFQQQYQDDAAPARKPKVGDRVIIRPHAVCNTEGGLNAQQKGALCEIKIYEADDDGAGTTWNLPYLVEAPNGDAEWMRASEFDVVTELSKNPPKVDSPAVAGKTYNYPEYLAEFAPKNASSFYKAPDAGYMHQQRIIDEQQARIRELHAVNAKWEDLHTRIGALLLPERQPAEVNVLDTLRTLITERDSLLARVKTLEAALTPFALAALVHDETPEVFALVATWDEKRIYIGDSDSGYLQIRHLHDALEALPDVQQTGANASDESA